MTILSMKKRSTFHNLAKHFNKTMRPLPIRLANLQLQLNVDPLYLPYSTSVKSSTC